MKRFRRKKGSSLILVVFITAVVFTVATTMVAVVTNDYKTRVNESKKLQNLYQSDAQLDVVYNVIAKNADVAAMYAYNVAKYQYNNNNVTSSSALEREFKNAFVNFLMNGYNGEPILKQAINNRRLIKFDSANTTCEGYQDISNYKIDESDPQTDLNVNTGKDKDLQKNELNIVLTPSTNNDSIVAEVTSTFYSNNEVSDTDPTEVNGKLNNKKKITTKYTIEAPKYSNDVISTSVSNRETNQYAVEKAITADGNLNVQEGASLKVLGNYYDKDGKFLNTGDADIWIKGNDKSTRDKYNVENDKYAYGVVLGNGKLDVTGNVYTNGSLTLSNNSNANISKNLYAHNAYLGPIKFNDSYKEAGENELKASNIYTNNDLVMNSCNSSIEAENYVGMGDFKETNDKIDAAKNSSSIIVNSNKNSDGSNTAYGSKIKLNTATVAGLAYMNTDGNSYYTTGESIAVKGNYIAYSDSLATDGKSAIYNFEQYDPWTLLEGTPGEKATHFEKYFKDGSKNIEDGGIEIGKLSSTGAGVNNKGLVSHASAEEQANIVKTQNESKTAYGIKVYGMGNESYLKENVNEDLDKAGLACYKDISKMATVGGQNAMVNFGKLKDVLGSDEMNQLYSNIKLGTIYNNYNGYALLNANGDDMTIERTNSGVTITLGSRELVINEGDMPTDPKTGERTLNAVIITNGNITLKGSKPLNINGTVISSKDVNVEAGTDVTVKHDTVVISKTVAQNSQFFQDLLNGKPIDSTTRIEPVQVGVSYKGANNNAAAGWYDATKYLKKGLWKLEGENGGVLGK